MKLAGNARIKAESYQLIDNALFKGSLNGNQPVFDIPEYQRPYIWNKDEWEKLFSDITESDYLGYFVGTIICVDNGTSPNNDYTVYEVVDGQQRLTTLSLFFAAIYAVSGSYGDKLSKKQKTIFEQIQSQLSVEKASNGKYRSRIIPQNKDNVADYLGVLIEAGILDENTLDPNSRKGVITLECNPNNLIPKAYKYFKTNIEKYAEGNDDEFKDNVDEQIKRIEDILNKLNSTEIVKIQADSYSSANVLFETLNNRGVPLTITDLIKNRLFAALNKDDNFKIYQQEWEELIWKKIFNPDGKEISGKEQEKFFRDSYNAYRTSWNNTSSKDNDDKFPIGKHANLYKSYDEMITSKPLKVFTQIKKSAQFYTQIQGVEESDLLPHKIYEDLSRINGATSYILILYLVENHQKLQLSKKEFEKIGKLLISFFVRQNFTGTPSGNKLESIFIKYISEIETKNYTSSAIYENLVICLKNETKDANEEKFKLALKGDVYDLKGKNEAIRFVLIKLAESYLEKVNVNFWEIISEKLPNGKKKEYSLWTIEHVMPQTLSDDWKKMLGNEYNEIQKNYVHKLGNLTLTVYNGELGNKIFFDKKIAPRGGYDDDILAKGLNSYICQQTDWREKPIEERTNLLIERILKIFKW